MLTCSTDGNCFEDSADSVWLANVLSDDFRGPRPEEFANGQLREKVSRCAVCERSVGTPLINSGASSDPFTMESYSSSASSENASAYSNTGSEEYRSDNGGFFFSDSGSQS
ncbi:unnamed protein product [Oikopleura dioica]|uniref:Uncharacterized protein n=1 Tax=Oikopleura dioica TaxID=34765 RepID=E4X7Q8_OIKDI|nr:unnamed protein product [Oikopleura dioica]